MPGEFEGKIVVISGASRGIGRGIALAFARAGAQTVLASSSEQNLTTAAKVIAERFLSARRRGLWHPLRNSIDDDLAALIAEAQGVAA